MKYALILSALLPCLQPTIAAASGGTTDMPAMSMSSATDLNDPMNREGSGTSWLPDSTPVYGKMFMRHGDMLMVHGAMMPRYVDVGSKRGDRRADAPNWFMGMYSHPLDANSQIGARSMLSLDPITEGGFGYPLLYQTGETWHNQPLHDRQHPHDLFDEMSLTYSRLIGGGNSFSLYVADPGEPALGPPTYMHRLLAYDLPDAPISHHWQDATHISFGVATAGLNFGGKAKIEGSVFTGREPDENRYNFDKPRWDSYSGRVSFNPDANNAYQVSYGFQKNAEGDGTNQHRTTASWVFNKPLGDDSNFTSALVWGRNDLNTEGQSNSVLAEADLQRGANSVYTRLEQITKSGHELVLPAPLDAGKYSLGAYTVGGVHDIVHNKGDIDTGIGAAVTVDMRPAALTPVYGGSPSVSFEIFLRFRPSRMAGMGHGMAESGHTPAAMEMPAPHTPAETTTPPATPTSPTTQTSPSDPNTITAHPAPPVPAQTVPEAPPAPPVAAPPVIAAITASITSDPPKARAKNTLTVTLTDSNGHGIPGAALAATVSMLEMDMGALHPVFKDLGDGRYAADVRFSMPGPWRVALRATPPGGKAIEKTWKYRVVR